MIAMPPPIRQQFVIENVADVEKRYDNADDDNNVASNGGDQPAEQQQPPVDLYYSGRIPQELVKIFIASNRGETVDEAPENGYAFRMFRRGNPVLPNKQADNDTDQHDDRGTTTNNSTVIYPSNTNNEDTIWRRRSLFRKTVEQNEKRKMGFLRRTFGQSNRTNTPHSYTVSRSTNNTMRRRGRNLPPTIMERTPSFQHIKKGMSDDSHKAAEQEDYIHEGVATEKDSSNYNMNTNTHLVEQSFGNGNGNVPHQYDNDDVGISDIPAKKGLLNKFNVFRLVRQWNRFKSPKHHHGTNPVYPDSQVLMKQPPLTKDEKKQRQQHQQPQSSITHDIDEVVVKFKKGARMNNTVNNNNLHRSSNSITETTASISTPAISSVAADDSLGASSTMMTMSPVITKASVIKCNSKSMKKYHYRPPISSDDYDTPIQQLDINNHCHTVDGSTESDTDIVVEQQEEECEKKEEEKDTSTLQEYFDRMLSLRGYSTKTYASLSTAYHNDATPLQEASYSSYTVKLVKSGDAERLRTMLSCGLSPCPSNYYGESLLHIACRMGHSESLRVMLECGAIVQISDDVGRTPLHNACWTKSDVPNFDTVQLLLETDAFLMQLTDSRGSTPLTYVREEHWKQWKEFLDRIKDNIWPSKGGENNDCNEKPVLACLGPNTFPMKDPPHALNLELARMVAVGTIEPEDAMLLQDEDFRDSLNGMDDDDDEEDDENTESSYFSGADGSCSLLLEGNSRRFASSKDSVLDDSGHQSLMEDDDIEEMLSRIVSSVRM